MPVLTPQGQRPGARTDGLHLKPEHRGADGPARAAHGLRSFDPRAAIERLGTRTIFGVVAMALAVTGFLAVVILTGGGGDAGVDTLTAPGGDSSRVTAPAGTGDQLVNRSSENGDTDPSRAGGIETGSVADAEDGASADGSPDGTNGDLADSDGAPAAAGSPTPSPTPSIPTSIGPPTTTADAAGSDSPSTAATDPTSSPPPTSSSSPSTAAPTTAAPATDPPTTAAPTTAAPTTAAPTTAAPATDPPETRPPTPTGSAEQQVLSLVNAERAKAGCGAVTLNGRLNAAALAHSQDMSANDYFSHTGLNGSQPWDRAEAAGYDYRSIGENIAYGYGSAERVMNGWMNSSGHRANILNCNFTEMGLGHVAAGDYWTQLFGRPS